MMDDGLASYFSYFAFITKIAFFSFIIERSIKQTFFLRKYFQ